MLTMREHEIANKILIVNRPIKIKSLSDSFNVSVRTVKYDLENIREFFKIYKVTLYSSSGKGIWIQCSEEQKKILKNELIKSKRNNLYFNQEVRVQKILFYLLSKESCSTANEIAQYLHVSRNTVIGDLDYIEIMLLKSNITLLRKQRVGYKLEGKETGLRSFLESVIQKTLSEYDVYKISEKIKSGNLEETIELFLPEPYLKYYNCIELNLTKAFKETQNLKETEIIPLIINLLASISRLKIGFSLESFEKAEMININKTFLYPYIENIYKSFGLPVLNSELEYINGNFSSKQLFFDIAKLTKDIINFVSLKDNFPYYEDKILYSNLLSHLSTSLNDKHPNKGENPFNYIIKERYLNLFNYVKEACLKYMSSKLVIFNESFISYIVLHFLSARRSIVSSYKKIKAIFVCATGRGAANIIKQLVETEINSIEILKNCSLLEVEAVSNELRPDLIISVFPIKSTIPVIVVDPLPNKENISFIKEAVAKLRHKSDDFHEHDIFLGNIQSMECNNIEEISKSITVLGLNIYNNFINEVEKLLKPEHKFSFLTHIMLLSNRIYFNKQYVTYKEDETNSDLEIKIKFIFDKLKIEIEDAEISAIRQFFV